MYEFKAPVVRERRSKRCFAILAPNRFETFDRKRNAQRKFQKLKGKRCYTIPAGLCTYESSWISDELNNYATFSRSAEDQRDEKWGL